MQRAPQNGPTQPRLLVRLDLSSEGAEAVGPSCSTRHRGAGCCGHLLCLGLLSMIILRSKFLLISTAILLYFS